MKYKEMRIVKSELYQWRKRIRLTKSDSYKYISIILLRNVSNLSKELDNLKKVLKTGVDYKTAVENVLDHSSNVIISTMNTITLGFKDIEPFKILNYNKNGVSNTIEFITHVNKKLKNYVKLLSKSETNSKSDIKCFCVNIYNIVCHTIELLGYSSFQVVNENIKKLKSKRYLSPFKNGTLIQQTQPIEGVHDINSWLNDFIVPELIKTGKFKGISILKNYVVGYPIVNGIVKNKRILYKVHPEYKPIYTRCDSYHLQT